MYKCITELEAGQSIGNSGRIEHARWLLKRAMTGVVAIVVLLALSGCGNPYALKVTGIDYDQKQAPGVIQLADPKIYKREALINERRAELAYLKTLLDESKGVNFEAQIVREIELIRSFAGVVGLNFDAGAELEFQRARELGDVQHQIQLTRLEMQLAQLERDAELLRDKLAAQDEQSQLAPDGDVQTADLPSGSDAPDLNELLVQVAALRTFVASRLDTESKPARKSSAASSPIEKFHDREAYRDTIKAAINNQRLDEIHDMKGNSLFRVQFQATVFPSPGTYVDTLGLLRMEIEPPKITDENREMRKLYNRWLWHVMQRLNRPPSDAAGADARFEQDQLLLGMGQTGGLFDVFMMEVAKDAKDRNRCRGWQESERNTKKCWYLRIPVSPDTAHTPPQLDNLISQDLTTQITEPSKQILLLRNPTRSLQPLFKSRNNCQYLELDPSEKFPRASEINRNVKFAQNVKVAQNVRAMWLILSQSLLHIANTDLGTPKLEAQLRHETIKVIQSGDGLRAKASQLLREVIPLSDEECGERFAKPWLTAVPMAFRDTIRSIFSEPGKAGNRVSVYDVSPTERVHRVSTAARAADAIAMAASLAGTLPSAGVAGGGNFAYTRSSVGKADALERAPLVIGFVEPGAKNVTWTETNRKGENVTTNHNDPRHPAFGWLLGPRVTLNSEAQELQLEHYLAPYELHADLSMPGWWPYFDLKVYSAWAPSWRNQNTTAKSFDPTEPRLERIVRVPMRHNQADMQGLTQVLMEDRTGWTPDQPRISEVRPRNLTICSGRVTVAIEGTEIWRASEVHIGGYRVPENGIRILPDMTGVAVTVAATDLPALDKLGTEVVVWTHNGKAANRDVQFTFASDTKACVQKPSEDKPVVTRVLPSSISACDSDLVFTVEGRNLWAKDQETKASLGTMEALLIPDESSDGTVVQVKANVSDRFREIGGLSSLTLVLKTEHGVARGDVNVVPSDACNVVNPPGPPSPPQGAASPRPEISRVLPSTFSACDDHPRFTVLGKNLDGFRKVMFGTIPATVLNDPPPSADSFEITVKHPKLATKLIGLKTIEVVARTERGIAVGTVNLKPGKCP